MQVSKIIDFLLMLIAVLTILLSGCKREIPVNTTLKNGNTIYGIDPVNLYTSAAEKIKQKNATQFISIAYSDLFQKSIPGNKLTELSMLSLSIGDKLMANEIFIGGFLNDPNVIIPTKTEMTADIDGFIESTYIRFYLRKPTSIEKYYFNQLITNDPDITPEIIYTAFTRSNEYWFY